MASISRKSSFLTIDHIYDEEKSIEDEKEDCHEPCTVNVLFTYPIPLYIHPLNVCILYLCKHSQGRSFRYRECTHIAVAFFLLQEFYARVMILSICP